MNLRKPESFNWSYSEFLGGITDFVAYCHKLHGNYEKVIYKFLFLTNPTFHKFIEKYPINFLLGAPFVYSTTALKHL